MNNPKFAAIVGAVVAATLGVASQHRSPVSAIPVVIVYHESTLRPDQASPSSVRFWTLAVRSDGANMVANSVPDASGRIEGVKSVQLQDRYVLVDSTTTSISTYAPYRPIVVGQQSCSGESAGSILNHPVKHVRVTKPSAALKEPREQWLAADLNCLVLREHILVTDKEGTGIQFFREAVSIKPGEPPAEYFEIPSNYVERGPAEINSEFEKRFPGKYVIPHPEVLNKLQHVYETDKPSK